MLLCHRSYGAVWKSYRTIIFSILLYIVVELSIIIIITVDGANTQELQKDEIGTCITIIYAMVEEV